ncbi:MAG TPA: SDR family NAD(P)-dependent oxidoreductase [Caulobacteraceae bacterium]|nr:SDR family NAD(P)-dependent oxidoreductase [Caulobacteraceae bacterium]
MSLAGKTIAVTGAFGVLGRAVASAAEAAGARVARLDAAKTDASGDLVFEGLDLTDEPATTAAMAEIARAAGGLHGLVNVAGGFTWQTVADSPAEVWEAMFRINLMTAVTASRAALPHLKASRGAIVNIGANAAGRAAAGMAPYTASKAGVARFTEALAEELAGSGVRVNAVLPNIIDTPANRRDMPKADFSAWQSPDQIAKVIVFLLSDAAAAVTGAAIPVTNGQGTL